MYKTILGIYGRAVHSQHWAVLFAELIISFRATKPHQAHKIWLTETKKTEYKYCNLWDDLVIYATDLKHIDSRFKSQLGSFHPFITQKEINSVLWSTSEGFPQTKSLKQTRILHIFEPFPSLSFKKHCVHLDGKVYIFSPECSKDLGEFMLILATVNPSLAIKLVKTLQGYSSHSISSDLCGDQGPITTWVALNSLDVSKGPNWALPEIGLLQWIFSFGLPKFPLI